MANERVSTEATRQAKAIDDLCDVVLFGHLLAATDPTGLVEEAARQLKELREECRDYKRKLDFSAGVLVGARHRLHENDCQNCRKVADNLKDGLDFIGFGHLVHDGNQEDLSEFVLTERTPQQTGERSERQKPTEDE